MSLFSKRVLPFTLLGAAAALGGCAGDASLEGDDEQETQTAEADPESADAIDPDAAEAVGSAQQAVTESEWICWQWWGKWVDVGHVKIWWGHTPNDALWACQNWVARCYNHGDGCYVRDKTPIAWSW
ncbi:hypothetical protein WMF11_18315 [Sorangium sp. So ce295]|uniref:hypothetical protein n=1 Tax=Sorangium sp. So ce295 TaxID=3133295 RepID=UPI003F5DE8E0